MTKFLILITAALCMVGCFGNSENQSPNSILSEVSQSKQSTIYLQPYDDYSQQEAEKLKENIKIHHVDFGSVKINDIIILPNRPLTEDLMNDKKSRYRADKIIPQLRKELKKNSTIIGLTHKDISVSLHGKQDWGVIGLAFKGSNACVISTFRMRNKADFWKAAGHEFSHAYYGADHCAKDDPHCILQDAKGKYTFGRATGLCEYCKSQF